MDPYHLLHQLMVGPTPVHGERLRSRHTFEPAVRKLLSELSEMSIGAAHWIALYVMRSTLKINQSFAFFPKAHYLANWHGFAIICFGKPQPQLHWCWKISVIHVQMGTCSYIYLWMRRIRSKCSPCDFEMNILTCPQKIPWNADLGWWNSMLAR